MILRIIEETKKCIDNECFIAALTLAITIPDICGKAEFPTETSTKRRYINWYNTYIGEYEKPIGPYGGDMPYSSGELIYSLRNSMLHQGTPNIDSDKVSEERCKVNKFILTISNVEDGGTSMVSYGKEMKITERMLQVNIVNLCSKICAAAKGYYYDNQNKFDFFQYELEDIRHTYNTLFSDN